MAPDGPRFGYGWQLIARASLPGSPQTLSSSGVNIEGIAEIEGIVHELSMIMQRLADASVNLRFVYLATDTRVVIGLTTSLEPALRSIRRRTNSGSS